jgi:hypothetical protein
VCVLQTNKKVISVTGQKFVAAKGMNRSGLFKDEDGLLLENSLSLSFVVFNSAARQMDVTEVPLEP